MSLKIEQGFRKGFDLGGDAAHGAYLRDRSDWKASHQDRGDHIIECRVDIRALSVLVLKCVTGGVSRKPLNQRQDPVGIVFELLKEFVQLYKLLESADRKADSHDLHEDPVLWKSSTVPVRRQP